MITTMIIIVLVSISVLISAFVLIFVNRASNRKRVKGIYHAMQEHDGDYQKTKTDVSLASVFDMLCNNNPKYPIIVYIAGCCWKYDGTDIFISEGQDKHTGDMNYKKTTKEYFYSVTGLEVNKL